MIVDLCPFCNLGDTERVYDFINAIPKDILSYNRQVLFRNDHFVVIPDISPISEFHLLIVPIDHYMSFTEIPQEFNPFLEEAKHFVNRLLPAGFEKNNIYFEHGTCRITEAACIAHAHLHCLPISQPEKNMLLQKVRKISEHADPYLKNESYLAVEIDGERFQWKDESNRKQYLRGLVSATVGRKERAIWQRALVEPNEKMLTKYWLKRLFLRIEAT